VCDRVFRHSSVLPAVSVVFHRRRPEMEDDSDVVSESKGDGAPPKRIPDGFCVECEDQPASVLCLVCEVGPTVLV
jgi:hypothetical protein